MPGCGIQSLARFFSLLSKRCCRRCRTGSEYASPANRRMYSSAKYPSCVALRDFSPSLSICFPFVADSLNDTETSSADNRAPVGPNKLLQMRGCGGRSAKCVWQTGWRIYRVRGPRERLYSLLLSRFVFYPRRMECQRGLAMRKIFVCLSVRPSRGQTRTL